MTHSINQLDPIDLEYNCYFSRKIGRRAWCPEVERLEKEWYTIAFYQMSAFEYLAAVRGTRTDKDCLVSYSSHHKCIIDHDFAESYLIVSKIITFWKRQADAENALDILSKLPKRSHTLSVAEGSWCRDRAKYILEDKNYVYFAGSDYGVISFQDLPEGDDIALRMLF